MEIKPNEIKPFVKVCEDALNTVLSSALKTKLTGWTSSSNDRGFKINFTVSENTSDIIKVTGVIDRCDVTLNLKYAKEFNCDGFPASEYPCLVNGKPIESDYEEGKPRMIPLKNSCESRLVTTYLLTVGDQLDPWSIELDHWLPPGETGINEELVSIISALVTGNTPKIEHEPVIYESEYKINGYPIKEYHIVELDNPKTWEVTIRNKVMLDNILTVKVEDENVIIMHPRSKFVSDEVFDTHLTKVIKLADFPKFNDPLAVSLFAYKHKFTAFFSMTDTF